MQKNETIPCGAALEDAALETHLRAAASECRKTGMTKLPSIHRAISRLDISLASLRVRGDANELTPASKWLVDNARVLEEACVTARADLRALPALPAHDGEPRIARFAREWLSHTDARADRESLYAAACAWQRAQPLTEGELCALPLAVRRALLLLLSDLSHKSAQAEIERTHAEAIQDIEAEDRPDAYFERLSSIMLEQEDAEGLSRLDKRLEEMGTTAQALAEREHERQTRACLWTGNAIASLRAISSMEFRAEQEKLSSMHPYLMQDPTGVYPRMDYASRAMYRRRAAKLSSIFRVAESTVARKALSLSESDAAGTLPELSRHIGYYLMDAGQPMLWRALGKTPPRLHLQRIIGKSAATGYVALITIGSLLATLLLWLLGVRSFLVGPALMVAGEAFRQLVGLLIHRLSPPRRMACLSPDQLDEGDILVVVPTLLTSRQQALEMVRHLSVLRLANPESRLSYMLLGDFRDGPAITETDDIDITDAALSATRAISDVWNGGFYYLHRKREWNELAGRFMGRERKRGALAALNALITTGECADEFSAASCDPAELHGKFAQIITLDADTQLPPGTPLMLAGMIQHPLNKPLTVDGKRRGCAIIQPRMETSAATVHTRIARLWGGDGGFDPYITAFSDIYQNLCGEGSFAGKGIYDVDAFVAATHGKIAENTVLSHDLLEGALSGSSLACDVSLYDGQPATLSGWMKRLHRWTRGDWQLLPWLIPFVKGPDGWFRNPLSILSQFKVYDNLRRSLVPLASVLLIVFGVLRGELAAVLSGLLLPHVRSLMPPSPRSLLAALTHFILMPHEAYQLIDAAARTVYRVLISRKRLLEWLPSAEAERHRAPDSPMAFLPSYISAAAVLLSSIANPVYFFVTVPIAALWGATPLIVKWLNAPEMQKVSITADDRAMLMDVAKRTFHFFETVVTDATHHLPPDNVQLEPDRGIAPRTSPTNIGMYLLSCVSACEIGLIDADTMARRMEKTIETIERMEKWHGHLYNWYDIHTLAPLSFHYVSSVDGGNLAACLLLSAQAVRSRLSEIDAALRPLPSRLDALAAGMDFSKLYDESCDLFYIGVHAESGLPDGAHYDLLASESRILSYIALMRREVPHRHWHRLGRAMARTQKGAALLSWSGTMFEYLLPQLFFTSPPRTLLYDTCLHAALAQKLAIQDAPFGISESGYYAFDPALSYQYKAFGLPELSLRTAREERVIAPYASVLSLSVLPEESIANMRRMAEMGWLSELGFYEAADYQPERMDGDVPYRLVKSHMAHHQGMILSAICNLLTGDALTRHFKSLPQAEAYALLLEERKPTRAMLRRAPKTRLPLTPPQETRNPTRMVQPEDFPPEVQVMHGGGTTYLCDARGGGYIAHNGLLLTRHRQDPLYMGGPQVYLRIGDAVHRMGRAKSIHFASSSAQYALELPGLSAQMTCFVSPLSGSAIQLLSLHASPEGDIDVDVASFFEVCLSTRADDESHPAFRNLSVETERLCDTLCVARRRTKHKDERFPLLVHAVCADNLGPVQLETSRMHFLGRGERLENPEALTQPFSGNQGHTGAVLDPCMSLRTQLHIAAGTTAHCWFITGAAADAESAEQLAAQYPAKEQVYRALELSAMQDDVNARYMGLGNMRLLAQRLATYLVHPLSQASLPAAPRSALWQHAISGDLPIVCVRIAKETHLPLARTMLRAHAYLRGQGLWSDLVILCEGEASYMRPLHDALLSLIASGPTRDLKDRDAGVHLFDCTQWDASTLHAFLGQAAFIATGGAGGLMSQLKAAKRHLPLPEAEAHAAPMYPVNQPLSAGALGLDNSFGGFRPDGGYVVYETPPAPYANVLANGTFGSVLTERGGGFTFADNSRMRRVTAFASDPVRDMRTEHLFLRDEDSMQYTSLLEDALVTHGFGFTRFEKIALGVRVSVTVFVDGELPVKCMLVELSQFTSDVRQVSITACVQWLLGSALIDAVQVRCELSGSSVIARSPAFPEGAFLSMAGRDVEASCDGAAFFGTGSANSPRGMQLRRLDGEEANVPCGILRTRTRLGSGEKEAICVLLGTGDCAGISRTYQGGGAQLRLSKLQLLWQSRQSALMPRLPDTALSLMLSCWLPYQAMSSRVFAHAGFYQAGGAIGFRDQLQDMLCLLHTDPDRVRAHILDAAAHQFEAGDVQHWWHPPAIGVRTHITDDRLFLPYVTSLYIEATEDTAILSEQVPFLADVQIPEGREDYYGPVELSDVTASLHEHCLRAISRMEMGEHGIPLMGAGDWNDGMSAVGINMRGESVWLGFFLAYVLLQYAEHCTEDESAALRAQRETLMESLEAHAWDGAWYRRAWFDDGTPLGSQDSVECRIDLVAQAWAVFAGAKHAEMAFDSALSYLRDTQHGTLRLLDPPFDGATEPGYIRAYPPGIRENGGQYTHAACWFVQACQSLGRSELAFELLSMLMPTSHAKDRESAIHYRVEPYVIAADVSGGQHAGRGGWSWYTGSAALLWSIAMTNLLGFEKRGNRIRLVPNAPRAWQGYSIEYRHLSTIYVLRAERSAQEDAGFVELVDDGGLHEIVYRLG